MPTSRRHQQQTIMFWISITQLNNNKIAKKIYIAAKISADTDRIENWPHQVKQLLFECNLLQWWKKDMCSYLSRTECKNMVNSILLRFKKTEWRNEVTNKPKLRTYQKFKSEYIPEACINLVTCRLIVHFCKAKRWFCPS